ncbi:MAG: F0F1 ATP synthase subunit B family protein [Bacteriovorax sp.]
MDTIVIILKALKIDQTVLIQFGILLVFFNILAPLFFKKIQEILELREGKTTKLESHAHHVYKQAEELAEQYKAKVEKTHQESQQVSQKKKSEVLTKERDLLKSAEEKLNSEYDERKSKILKEMSEKRSVVMAEADKLAGNLVEKLIK